MQSVQRALLWMLLAFCSGCSFSEFWAGVADTANSGKGYQADFSTNRDREYVERFAQQEAVAREYFGNDAK
jgi:hypothetical protein